MIGWPPSCENLPLGKNALRSQPGYVPAWVRFAKYNLQIIVLIHSTTGVALVRFKNSARLVVPAVRLSHPA